MQSYFKFILVVTYQRLQFLSLPFRYSSCELDFELSAFLSILQIQSEAMVPLF